MKMRSVTIFILVRSIYIVCFVYVLIIYHHESVCQRTTIYGDLNVVLDTILTVLDTICCTLIMTSGSLKLLLSGKNHSESDKAIETKHFHGDVFQLVVFVCLVSSIFVARKARWPISFQEKPIDSKPSSVMEDEFEACTNPLTEVLRIRPHQAFQQSYTVFPAKYLLSNFTSDSSHRPGSTPELYKEGVRLITYKSFPSSSPVSVLRLAQAGFYSLNDGDKVKCYSCGITYQGWRAGDKPRDIHAALSPTCPHILGQDCSNIPLPSTISSQPDYSQRQRGGNLDGTERANDGVLQHDGPEQDSRIGLSTPGVEEIPSSVDSAYASHPSIDRKGLTVTDTRSSTTSSSRPLSNTDVADSRSPVQSLTPSDASTDNSRQTSASHDLFPCPHLELDLAVYPMYALMDMRRRTYLNWRPISFLPGVDEFVMLGFFYAGYADCVRCFYCGIGLKSWEPGDDPSRVHANWRPNCGYLRLVKGDNFVNAVTGEANSSGSGTDSQTQDRINETASGSRAQMTYGIR